MQKRKLGKSSLTASDFRLTEDDLREIERVASHINVEGARYSEAAKRMINR